MMTAAINKSRASERAPRQSLYLVNPFFDYTFVCGGLALLLSACALSAHVPADGLAQTSTPVILLGILGTYLFSEPHSAATIFRLYGEADNRKRFAFVAFGLPLILAICFVAALYLPVVAKIMAVLYLIFISHHIMAQSFGIAMIYCARAGFLMSRADKNGMKAIIYTAVTLAVAQQFTTAWQRGHLLGIELPTMGFLPPQLITMLLTLVILTVIVFAIDLAIKHYRGIRHMPLPAVATLLTGTLVLSLNRSTSEVVWLFVPAFFHASQYMCVVFAYKLKREAEVDAERAAPEALNEVQSAITDPSYVENESNRMLKNLEFLGGHFVECFLVGLLIFSALPFALAACGLSLALCSALIFLCVNLHHFAADACIWKLKDKSIRSRLIL